MFSHQSPFLMAMIAKCLSKAREDFLINKKQCVALFFNWSKALKTPAQLIFLVHRKLTANIHSSTKNFIHSLTENFILSPTENFMHSPTETLFIVPQKTLLTDWLTDRKSEEYVFNLGSTVWKLIFLKLIILSLFLKDADHVTVMSRWI